MLHVNVGNEVRNWGEGIATLGNYFGICSNKHDFRESKK